MSKIEHNGLLSPQDLNLLQSILGTPFQLFMYQARMKVFSDSYRFFSKGPIFIRIRNSLSKEVSFQSIKLQSNVIEKPLIGTEGAFKIEKYYHQDLSRDMELVNIAGFTTGFENNHIKNIKCIGSDTDILHF